MDGADLVTGKTYVILGGGGSFGINTALYLLDHAAPKQVVGVGRSTLRPGAFSLGVEERDRFSYYINHIVVDHNALLANLDRWRPGVIINFAAQGEGAASWERSHLFFDTNASALVRLYEALSTRDYLQRFIHIGTSELYGSVDAPAKEDAPIVPSSPYAASKAAFDLYLLVMAKAGKGKPFTILRPSNCYCPGQLLHRIIPRAIVAGLTGKRVPLHGGGKAKKSYMHVRDLARAIHMVAEAPDDRYVYNVGPANPTSILEVATMCAAAVGLKMDDVFDVAPERVGQDGQYWLDSSAAHSDLGWSPEIDWETGLRSMCKWAEANLDQLRDWPTTYELRV